MAFVVDASVTMSWCFADEATPYTEAVLTRLDGESAIVPTIWPLEVANVLLVAERRGRLTKAQTARLTAILRAMPISIDHTDVLVVLGPVLALGREHHLSAYDASYLELAMREGLPLATQDERLRTAASRAGAALV